MTPQQKNIQTPKGTRDILPQDYAFYQNIFDKAEEICSYYGFKPIQTPHLEKIELFTSTVGAATDIVEKEMYTLKTSGGDNLALRPEGTASVVTFRGYKLAVKLSGSPVRTRGGLISR